MNKLIIIGNLTYDPVLRYTQDGIAVCDINVAVNRRYGEREYVDYFRASVWRGQAEACAKYLRKGSKVCLSGPVSCRAYTRRDGSAGAGMEIQAAYVEFLSSARSTPADGSAAGYGATAGYDAPADESVAEYGAGD